MAIQSKSRDEVKVWIEDFYGAAESLSTTQMHKFYAKDATLLIGNNEPITGLDNIVSFIGGTGGLLESMTHELIDFDLVGNKLYLVNNIYYVVKNDPKEEKFKVHAAGVCHFKPVGDTEESLLERFEIFSDLSAVFARVDEVASSTK